ncbi:MAG: esterase [Acidobacteria bacterium]|nr:MAG: esterase [Acidobacteriota bacterium]
MLSNRMGADRRETLMGWVQAALGRVREFAYAERPAQVNASVRPKLGLALGGGFARGIAHAGVLHTLEQHGIAIDYIAGTSAGALAGMAYASGLPFEEVVKRAAALRFGAFGQWRFSWLGLASNQKLEFYPKRYLNISTFEELRIPLTIAATDLITGEPVYFDHGPLGPPLRASCAYPGLFQPVEYEGRTLVDGFVGATVPVEAVARMGADVIIAVFLDAEAMVKPTNFTDVIGRSFTIIQRHADLAWRVKSDVVIEPRVRDFAWDDFAKTPQLIAAGEEATLAAMPRVRAALEAARERVAAEEPRAMGGSGRGNR